MKDSPDALALDKFLALDEERPRSVQNQIEHRISKLFSVHNVTDPPVLNVFS